MSPEQLAEQMSAEGATPSFYKAAPSAGASAAGSSTSPSSSSSPSGPTQTFQMLEGVLSEDLVQKINGVFQFDLSGELLTENQRGLPV